MSGNKFPVRVKSTGWPILIACVVAIAGCADTGISVPPSANEAPIHPTAGDTASALRMAHTTRSVGDTASAIAIYRNLVAAGAATDAVKVELGDTLLESGQPDDAIDIYSQVGPKSPARLGTLLGMTRAYVSLGDPAKALGYVDDAKLLNLLDPRVLVDRGVVLDALNRHAEAQECYRTVLSVTPRHVSARNDLALSLALTGQFDEAIALIGPLARSSSATPRVRENMAVIYGLMGDADHAAMFSRMDLDAGATGENLAFLAAVRGPKR